jgi:hypothetical protein
LLCLRARSLRPATQPIGHALPWTCRKRAETNDITQYINLNNNQQCKSDKDGTWERTICMIGNHLRTKDNTSHTAMLSDPHAVCNSSASWQRCGKYSPALLSLSSSLYHPSNEDVVGGYACTALGMRTSNNVADNRGGAVPRR